MAKWNTQLIVSITTAASYYGNMFTAYNTASGLSASGSMSAVRIA